jgi:hypothetical protein
LPVLALLLTSWSALDAQQPDAPTPPLAAAPPDASVGFVPVTPGRAFLRAVAVPGWGHLSIGEHTRGAFYFLTETGAAWMVVRTRSRLGAAKNVRDLRVAELRARLAAEGAEPAEILSAENSDQGVTAARALVEARSQQFEDWLVLGIFLMFLGGPTRSSRRTWGTFRIRSASSCEPVTPRSSSPYRSR